MISVGLVVNPIAGVGAAVALKGSDGVERQALATRLGGKPRAAARVQRTLRAMGSQPEIRWSTWAGAMGQDALLACGIPAQVLGAAAVPSTSADTRSAADALVQAGVDLLVFAGGDGTARDVLRAVGQSIPVLGIPAGVKMHSGVFATTPETAAEVLVRLARGGLVRVASADVRDWDDADAGHEVRPRFYGELLVPDLGGFLAHTKQGGRESEALAVNEIVAYVVELITDRAVPCVLGPGSTLAAVKSALGITPTLLGVDVLMPDGSVSVDVTAAWLEREVAVPADVYLSFTRGQGFLLGRGNQQLSARFLRRLGRHGLRVLGTRTKLKSLEGRALLVDTDDPDLDRALTGLIEVIAGYDDRLLYRVATHA